MQIPEEFQASIFNAPQDGCLEFWISVIGTCLKFVIWNLVLLTSPMPCALCAMHYSYLRLLGMKGAVPL
jgi:hypothetical protein